MDLNLKEVIEKIKDIDKVSKSTLQIRLGVGFNKASLIYNQLILEGYISKDGKVIKTKEDDGIKIIFLDIDGVLNCRSTKDRCGQYIGIEDGKVKLLKEIVDSCNAKLILVSTWKENWYKDPRLKSKQDDLANYLDEKLSKEGLVISDKTDDYHYLHRGDGILEYLRHIQWLGISVSRYIIIDDEIFDYISTKMTKHLISTSFKDGLLPKHVKRAIKLLNGQ